MSRIGKLPVPLAKGVTAALHDRRLTISGPKGRLERELHPDVTLEIAGDRINVLPPKVEEGTARGLHGLTRTLVANMVKGVTEGFEKHLEIQGVGYRAQVQNNKLTLFVGFSHQVDFAPPAGIVLESPKPTQIFIKGIDKELVGAVAAKLRFIRPPEVYKGKGIRYEGEYVRTKVGKAAAGASAGAGAAAGGGAKK